MKVIAGSFITSSELLETGFAKLQKSGSRIYLNTLGRNLEAREDILNIKVEEFMYNSCPLRPLKNICIAHLLCVFGTLGILELTIWVIFIIAYTVPSLY